MKTNAWSSAAVNGFLLALITVIFTLIQAAFPMSGMAVIILIWVVKLAATLGALYYFMKSFGQMQESCSYGQAFTYGFVVSLCSNIVISCYLWVHYTILFSDMVEKSLDGMQQAFTQYNVDPTAADLLMKNWPLVLTISPLILYTIYGLIFAAILASFVKKVEPVFPSETEE